MILGNWDLAVYLDFNNVGRGLAPAVQKVSKINGRRHQGTALRCLCYLFKQPYKSKFEMPITYHPSF